MSSSKFRRVVDGLSVGVHAVRRALRFLFGKVSWEPPPWLVRSGAGVRDAGASLARRPARAALVFLVALLIGGAGSSSAAGTCPCRSRRSSR
jgi:hypothetical protein